MKSTKNIRLKFCWKFIILGLSACWYPISINAQIVPDNTLGAESSTIRSIDQLRDAIEGGAIRGDNLFHSFSEFNVGEGTRVDFANPEGIANIFSRVTGGNISEIFGTLGVDGTANLFFMNPNGIVFGENAAVDVGGSFLATTAESIEFNNGNEFSTVARDKPLLTIDFPVGLGMGSDPGNIIVRGNGHNLEQNVFQPIQNNSAVSQAQMKPQKTFALVGADVFLEGAIVKADRIELGAVGSGRVKIDYGLDKISFDYSDISNFKDIVLSKKALLDNSFLDNSPTNDMDNTINIVGEIVEISDGSLILNQNNSSIAGGTIDITAKNSVLLDESPQSQFRAGIKTESFGTGSGADVNITTSELSINNGTIFTYTYGDARGGDVDAFASNLEIVNDARIGTLAFGSGRGGNIGIETSQNIELYNTFNGNIEETGILTGNSSISKGGNITISTNKLTIEDGKKVGSSTLPNELDADPLPTSKGGDVYIASDDAVRVSGVGNVLVSLESEVSSLRPSTIESQTFGSSNAGNLSIETSSLQITGGAQVRSDSFANGDSGNIDIRALDSIVIEGSVSDSIETLPSSISTSVDVADPILRQSANLPSVPEGRSGSLTIDAPSLSVTDSAVVTAQNQGTGDGGNLEIDSEQITLDNAGEISASTVSGNGGNIEIVTLDLELLNISSISASAGGSGDGGNITIDSNTILGLDNSDITANAVGGDGGNIQIDTESILGLESRSRLTSFSDITASSEFGIDGTVTINSPETNVEEDVVVVFKNYIPQSNREIVSGTCLDPNRESGGKLVYVGRGGVPENPYNFFDDEEIVAIERVREEDTSGRETRPARDVRDKPTPKNNEPQVWNEGDPIIDANAVKVGADGELYLVAETQLKDAQSQICSSLNEGTRSTTKDLEQHQQN